MRKGEGLIHLDDYEKELIAYSKEIIAYLMKSGVPLTDAQDIVQDVFVKLLESPLILPASKLRAWMYRVAVRRYIDLYRRDKKYQEILQLEFFQGQGTLFDGQDHQFMSEVIEGLPEKERVLLDLYYFQGFTVQEIAHILDLTSSNTKISLMRARQHLKKELKKVGYPYGNI